MSKATVPSDNSLYGRILFLDYNQLRHLMKLKNYLFLSVQDADNTAAQMTK